MLLVYRIFNEHRSHFRQKCSLICLKRGQQWSWCGRALKKYQTGGSAEQIELISLGLIIKKVKVGMPGRKKSRKGPRKQYDTVSTEKRRELIDLVVNQNMTRTEASERLGIKTSTGCLIVKTFLKKGYIVERSAPLAIWEDQDSEMSSSPREKSQAVRRSKNERQGIRANEEGSQQVKVEGQEFHEVKVEKKEIHEVKVEAQEIQEGNEIQEPKVEGKEAPEVKAEEGNESLAKEPEAAQSEPSAVNNPALQVAQGQIMQFPYQTFLWFWPGQ